VAAALTDADDRPLVSGLVVIGSALVVGHVAIVDSSPVARLLSLKPLVWTGKRSYGIYLFHFPLIVGATATVGWLASANGPERTSVFAFLALLLAAVSYRFVETPVQQWSRNERSVTQLSPSPMPVPEAN
jgi:peptidoglycan/LPS O-acetylase OafA/YrhL